MVRKKQRRTSYAKSKLGKQVSLVDTANPAIGKLSPVIAVLLLLFASFIIFDNFEITGFVVTEKSFTIELNDQITAITLTTTEVPLTLEAAPKSFVLDGNLIGTGTARVYLQIDNQRYLILDTSQLTTQTAALLTITGNVVADTTDNQTDTANETISEQTNTTTPTNQTTLVNATTPVTNNTVNQTTPVNQTNTTTPVNQTAPVNATPQISKIIDIILEYQSGTAFDTDDNGIETDEGAIDYAISADFNWVVNESNLCTRWKIDSYDTGDTTLICNGASACCSLVELAPTETAWDEALYITKGKYDTTTNNNVSAQVIYADLQTVDITYSNWQSLQATFLRVREFISECEETCTLPAITFNQTTNAKLIVELQNATLNIASITYTADIEENITPRNIPPKLILQIPNQTAPTTIDLNNYFSDANNDTLQYAAIVNGPATITINSNIATITATGKAFAFITANDSQFVAVSDVFNIINSTVTIQITEDQEILTQGIAEINKPVQWIKIIKLVNETNTSTQIPALASNITVKKNNVNIDDKVKVEKRDKSGKKSKETAKRASNRKRTRRKTKEN